jgi:CrcB protein
MQQVLLVAVGGALGSVVRFQIGAWAARWWPNFPAGTLLVNLCGCFLIGLVSALALKRGAVSDEARLLLVTGFLGGFTTFSAFGLETVALLGRGKYLWAGLNVLASVVGGLAAVWLGTTAATEREPAPVVGSHERGG